MSRMAEWEKKLSDQERDELHRAKVARDASADVYRGLVKKLKARCIKRLHRQRGKGDA